MFKTNQEAIEHLKARGFKLTESGFFVKRSVTQGSLIEAPRPCLAVCKIVCNHVDPKWALEGFNTSDYFTIQFC